MPKMLVDLDWTYQNGGYQMDYWKHYQIDRSICIIKNMLGIPVFLLFDKLPMNIAQKC